MMMMIMMMMSVHILCLQILLEENTLSIKW